MINSSHLQAREAGFALAGQADSRPPPSAKRLST
jgi:hypothetical protein